MCVMSDYAAVSRPAWPRRERKRGPAAVRWRERANAAIVTAIAAGKEAGLEGRELELYVSRNGYPFEGRVNHPYKVWLDEFHRILHGYRGPFDERAKANMRKRKVVPGQRDLFE
jgi:hypothetical protein